MPEANIKVNVEVTKDYVTYDSMFGKYSFVFFLTNYIYDVLF